MPLTRRCIGNGMLVCFYSQASLGEKLFFYVYMLCKLVTSFVKFFYFILFSVRTKDFSGCTYIPC